MTPQPWFHTNYFPSHQFWKNLLLPDADCKITEFCLWNLVSVLSAWLAVWSCDLCRPTGLWAWKDSLGLIFCCWHPEILIIFEEGSVYLYFALGFTNHLANPGWINLSFKDIWKDRAGTSSFCCMLKGTLVSA